MQKNKQKQQIDLSVLMVCTGNICRSPTAEVILRDLALQHAPALSLHVDSCGTHAYHVGEPPDPRSQKAAAGRGYDLSALRGRKIQAQDFVRFDWILALDRGHLQILQQQCPPSLQHKLALLSRHCPLYPEQDVPDPYYGGQAGFEAVLDRVESAAWAWLRWWQQHPA